MEKGNKRSLLLISVSLWGAIALIVSIAGCFKSDEKVASHNGSLIHMETPSSHCRECHEDVYESWESSHHYHANDLFKKEEWQEAFGRHQYYPRGGVVSEFYTSNGKPTIKTRGPNGKSAEFHPEMTLAYDPMVQFLIPSPGGRWQVTELAWDIHEKEWFSVYDDQEEFRSHEDWGSWTGRGMNWNAQCGICHTTHYSKNYDVNTDSYTSHWKEQGIACMQCHGEMREHLKDPEAPLVQSEIVDMASYYQSCYSCHSRREDITGGFRIGDHFSDHHRLQLPIAEYYYFPDGQIKEEVFVYGSFLQSKMYEKGVRCGDCHDPHSLELRLPVENNQMCMVCHQSTGVNGATPIDPVSHGNHAPGSIGNRCVECHMPERTYMARDPRRDHGFHSPDPFLSHELGVPNACSNCHKEEGLEWVKTQYEQWYGESDERKKVRERARIVDAAYKGDVTVVDQLLELIEASDIDIWRASYAQMALMLNPTPKTVERLLPYLYSDSYLIRSAVLNGLMNFPGFEPQIRKLLNDPSRLVRVDAAWYLRNELNPDSTQWKELMQYMNYTADQPGGALRMSEFHAGNEDLDKATEWMDKAIDWDRTSFDARLAKAFLMNRFGKQDEAIAVFEEAYKRFPENASPLFYMALIYVEKGDMDTAEEYLKKSVEIDPGMDRAWYNLGLLENQKGRIQAALANLDKAIEVNPDHPDYLYTKCTIFLQYRRTEELRTTVEKLVENFPEYAPGLQLKRMISN
jgi:tetratricopeptide (TPR) repeat protein